MIGRLQRALHAPSGHGAAAQTHALVREHQADGYETASALVPVQRADGLAAAGAVDRAQPPARHCGSAHHALGDQC